MRIGTLQIDDGPWLAPLATISSAPFRQICIEQGCALAVTEMVASEALVRDVAKVKHRMVRAANERHLVVQLFGGSPEALARAARMSIEQAGADIIDINMGCPVRKILGGGAGVALMLDPPRAEAIVRAVKQACGDSVPVTVKMRAGWDEGSINAVEFAQRLEEAGACAIAIHARTKEQVHRGVARYEIVAQVKEALSIPVIANGGIVTAQDAAHVQHSTGCDAVMIGRATLGNPWLFRSISDGRDYTPTVQERFDTIRHHIRLNTAYAGDRATAREMRKHLCWYLRGLPASASVRSHMQAMMTSADMLDIVDRYEHSLAHGYVPAPTLDVGLSEPV